MTEYDYSPEAYERFMATQNRIANWVDKTEQHRPEFKDALNYGPEASSRPSPASYDSHSRLKRSPPPSPPHHQHYGHSQPRHLFIHPPPPESESSEGYGEGPGRRIDTGVHIHTLARAHTNLLRLITAWSHRRCLRVISTDILQS
ncbi:hypothetical protein B0H34DRAFT_670402 [Crassisporium funariophilum]|nr:hypothetical protein B0H34DRAFT_670402 [Crassisporium funariophilum]